LIEEYSHLEGDLVSSLYLRKTLLGVLKDCGNLMTSHTGKPFQKLVDSRSGFKIFKKSAHRYPRASKDPGTTDFVFRALDFGTISPVQHAQHDMLRSERRQAHIVSDEVRKLERIFSVSEKIQIICMVNQVRRTFQAYPMERLLDVLRDELRLTGTKEGCGEGECGACSVMIDGQLVNSCLVPVAQVEGCSIKTIEGLALEDRQLHDVQQAFIECGGAQCGICTPGMIMAAVNLLEKNPNPTESEIRDGLAGNLCRCTGYMKIFESVARACQK